MKKSKTDSTFIDLFACIGGLRKAFEPYGKCVFSSELNEYSKKTYCQNFPGSLVSGNITKINAKEIPDHDILLAGFPCQPFSLAGVSKKNYWIPNLSSLSFRFFSCVALIAFFKRDPIVPSDDLS